MATDPNTLLPAPPPEDLALAGRIRAALASRDTSTKDIENIIAATGREVTDEMRNVIAANVDFVRQGGDIDLVTFNFLPLVQPEPTPTSLSTFFPDGAEAPRYTDTIASRDPTFQERAYRFVLEQAAPFFGADPKQSREAAELLVGRREAPRAALMDITPLAALTSLPEGASTFSTGVRFGQPGTAALGALETAGGVAEALPLAGPLFRGSRRFAREFTRTSPAAGGAVSREAVEAFSPSQVPPTAPAPPAPLTPIERIAQAPTLPPALVTPIRRAEQVPELSPAEPRAAAAAPKAPDPIRDLPTAPKDEIPQVSIPEPVRVTPEQRAIDAAALDAAPPEELRNILTPTRQSEILAYQGDYATELAKMGIFRPKNMPLTEFIQAHMLADTVPDTARIALMEKHGIRSAEDQLRAAGISRESLSRAAQDLNRASQLERQLQRLFAADPELAEKFGASKEALRQLKSPYHRLLGVESGALTSQISTVMRNFLGASGVMPTYNALVEIMDVGLRAGRNIGRAPEEKILGPNAADVLYSFWDQLIGTYATMARPAAEGLLNAPRAAINQARVRMGLEPLTARDIRIPKTRRERQKDEFMEAFRAALPGKYNKLFGRWASDQPLPRGDTSTKFGKAMAGAENAVDFINIPTQIVDRGTKNAQFMSILEMEAKRAGVDLNKLFDEGRLSELAEGDTVDKAIRLMHKRAFEDRPEGPEWYNEAARAAVTLMNYTTRPLGATPFPNFWVSAFKHVFEQNPLAIVRFASKAERDKIAKGDHRAVTQIGAGLATTLAYYALKDPDDGTQWFEFKVDDTPVDMSAAMAPHLPSMLQAHLLHLAEQDRLNEFDWGKDLAKVLGTSNLRAGVGQYAVDEGFSEAIRAAQTGDMEGAKRVGENWVRERVSGWPIFFRNFRDVLDREQAVINRDPQTIGQELAINFPQGSQIYEAMTGEEIPQRFAPTRPEATRSGDPLLRQLTGALIREPRNKLEEFVVDLGMSNSDLVSRSGLSDTYDRLMVQEVGRLAGEEIEGKAPLLQRVERREAELRDMPPEELRMRIRKEYTDLRKIARDNLAERVPIYRSARYYDGLSRDEKIAQDKKDMANPKRGRTFPEFFREVEEAGIRATAFTEAGRRGIPSGTTYVDMPTYSIKVKP